MNIICFRFHSVSFHLKSQRKKRRDEKKKINGMKHYNGIPLKNLYVVKK